MGKENVDNYQNIFPDSRLTLKKNKARMAQHPSLARAGVTRSAGFAQRRRAGQRRNSQALRLGNYVRRRSDRCDHVIPG
jgi:hypothetical protein